MLWWMNHVCHGNIIDQDLDHRFQEQSEAGQNNRRRDLLSKWSQESRQYPQLLQLSHVSHQMPGEEPIRIKRHTSLEVQLKHSNQRKATGFLAVHK